MHKSNSSFSRLAFWVMTFVLGFGATVTASAADEADSKGTLFGSVVVPAKVSQSELHEAIIATLLGREWTIQSKKDGEVVGYLKHRSNEATVTLAYDTSRVQIFCVGYQINKKTGAREKPEQPTGWLKNIQSDLSKNLNRIAGLK
jgi:hypothetical protein